MIDARKGSPYVTTWANKPAISTLTPYTDRVMITNVGVGGSEWYSDGTRWRAVGGQVTVIKLGAQTPINGSTATSDLTLLIDAPTTSCKIPAGLFQIGDRVVIETYINKPNATTPVASNGIRYRIGTTASASDMLIGTDSAISSANRVVSSIRFVEILTDTTLRKWIDFISATYTSSNNADTVVTGIPSLSSNNLYLTVTSGLAAGTASDTLQLLSFTVTLKTCG